MEYSETILDLLKKAIEDMTNPARELRRQAESIRLGRCGSFIKQLEKTLGYPENSIEHEKLRQHFLEAARRLEK